jgi:hypothetical protein
MNTPIRPAGVPRDDGAEWLDLLVADSEGNPQRVMAIGVTVMLQNGEHVPAGLVRNGYRQAWRPV